MKDCRFFKLRKNFNSNYWFANVSVFKLHDRIIFKCFSFHSVLEDALSQTSSVTSSVNNAGVYEIPARLKTLHNLVIQYASQVITFSAFSLYLKA